MTQDFVSGQRTTFSYQSRSFEVIVIDPNGLGKNQPSVGFGLRMFEKHGGLPEQTLSDWTIENEGFGLTGNTPQKRLKVPSGNTYRLTGLAGLDNHNYLVMEVSDWFKLTLDVLRHPGKVRKPTLNKLLDFLGYFAVKGFYADAYVALKGAYTDRDKRATDSWLESRLAGIPIRKKYTDTLQKAGIKEGYEYANWTNCIYYGLFGMTAAQMKQAFEHQQGVRTIARTYIEMDEALEAVAYCEDLVIRLWFDGEDLAEVHNLAIARTLKKYSWLDEPVAA